MVQGGESVQVVGAYDLENCPTTQYEMGSWNIQEWKKIHMLAAETGHLHDIPKGIKLQTHASLARDLN